MAAFGEAPRDLVREVTPRPGHADLVGALRTNTDDCRNILERASARETAAPGGRGRRGPGVSGGTGSGSDVVRGVGGGCGHARGDDGRRRRAQAARHRAFGDALSGREGDHRHEEGHRPREVRRRELGRHLPHRGLRACAGARHLRHGRRSAHLAAGRSALFHPRHQGRGIRPRVSGGRASRVACARPHRARRRRVPPRLEQRRRSGGRHDHGNGRS